MDQARLRPAQVGASTVAAVGGAFLATRLGIYGTIIGVGVITLMSTVGSEMLLRSLERTKQAARQANPRERGVASSTDASTETLELAATDPISADDPADASEVATIELPGTAVPTQPQAGTTEQPTISLDAPEAATTEQPATTAPAATPGVPADDQPAKARRWPLVAGGFLASFGLALAVIAGIEAFTGQSLGGEDRPTVFNVIRGDVQRTDDVAPVPATPTDEPTPPAPEDDGSSSGATDDGSAPRSEPTTPVESPSPDDNETALPDEDEPTPPDEDETPSPEEETPPEEEQTTPDDQPTPTP